MMSGLPFTKDGLNSQQKGSGLNDAPRAGARANNQAWPTSARINAITTLSDDESFILRFTAGQASRWLYMPTYCFLAGNGS